jgi:hypothetical protein
MSESKVVLKQFIRANTPEFASDPQGNVYRLEGRPNRIGVLVSTGPGKWGYSIISPKEDFTEVIPKEWEVTFTKNGKTQTKKMNKTMRVWNSKRIWEFGTRLAEERAEGLQPMPKIIPKAARKDIERFQKRMEHYFK